MSTAVTFDLSLEARPASQVTTQAVAWLWPGRLALGKLAMLDADPGMGKSILTLELCARMSTGRPFPDGSPCPSPASSLLLNAEDGEQDTVLPRLRSLGADLDRVFLLAHEDPKSGMPLRLPTQVDVLEKNVARTQARLVVIDPVVAFLATSVQTSNDQSVRQALCPLAQLATRQQCVILMVRHLNKLGGTRSLYRGGGSIGFVGACRSVWLLARDLHVPRHRVLAQVKNNLAAPQPSLVFSLPETGAAAPALTWHGSCEATADELLGGALASAGLTGPRNRAKDFLAGFLEDGPRTSREVWEEAEAQDICERTLRRARGDLEIRSHRIWVNGKIVSYWLLPDQKIPTGLSPAADANDLEPWLGPLRKQFPPATPLDDL